MRLPALEWVLLGKGYGEGVWLDIQAKTLNTCVYKVKMWFSIAWHCPKHITQLLKVGVSVTTRR